MLCVVTVLFRRSIAFQNAFNATGTKFANSPFDDVGTDQSLSYYLDRFPRSPGCLFGYPIRRWKEVEGCKLRTMETRWVRSNINVFCVSCRGQLCIACAQPSAKIVVSPSSARFQASSTIRHHQ